MWRLWFYTCITHIYWYNRFIPRLCYTGALFKRNLFKWRFQFIHDSRRCKFYVHTSNTSTSIRQSYRTIQKCTTGNYVQILATITERKLYRGVCTTINYRPWSGVLINCLWRIISVSWPTARLKSNVITRSNSPQLHCVWPRLRMTNVKNSKPLQGRG